MPRSSTSTRLSLPILLALASGCGVAALNDFKDALRESATATDDGASTTDAASMTAGDPPGPISTLTTDPTVATTTDAITDTDASESTATTTASTTDPIDTDAPADNAPPYIHWLLAEPSAIAKAGPIELTALFSEDVSDIDLTLDDELVAVLTPADFPYTHVVTSAAQNGLREFRIRVRDPEGLEAVSMPAEVDVALPESGSPVWKLIGDDPKWAEGRAITPFADGVALGGLLAQNGLSTPIIRHYDAQKSLRWTIVPVSQPGAVTALAVAPDGDLIAVGVADKGGLRPWIARLDAYGNLDFGPIFGHLAETPTGVAVGPDGSIYVSGYVQTLDEGKFDAMLWAYDAKGGPKWHRQWDNPGFDKPAKSRDQAHGVAVLADGSIAIAGETTVQDEVNQFLANTRAFVRRYAASNALLGTWVAGKYPAKHSAAMAIAADSNGGVLVGGWSSSSPNLTTTPLSVDLDQELVPTWFRSETTGDGGIEAIHGIGRLPEGGIVVAMTVQGPNSRDILVRAFVEQGDALWELLHVPSAEDDRVGALALGEYGAIYFAGGSGSSKIVAGELAP